MPLMIAKATFLKRIEEDSKKQNERGQTERSRDELIADYIYKIIKPGFQQIREKLLSLKNLSEKDEKEAIHKL